nr:threonine dehydratase biosynthetic, chloroplastic-like [Tanacetum cinerariifolium]
MESLCFTPHVTFRHNDVTKSTRTKRSVTVTATVLRTTQKQSPSLVLLKVSPSSLQYESGHLGAVPDHKVDEGDGALSEMEYLTNILSSNRVYDVAIESPLSLAPKLSERLGVNVWLKREDLQPVFSFKLRGAYNMMAKLPKEQLDKGVICSSAGNHAQGVALAAKTLGCDAVIVMPVTTPQIKSDAVKRLGATVELVGDSYDEAQAYAKSKGEKENRTFIPPFDHPDIIMGQGTVGMEIVRQMQGPIHAIFVPVGGGGLIAGIAAYVKRVSPEVRIIGVEPADANAMALSLHHGKRVILDQVGGFADGVAVKEVGSECFRLCRELIDGVVLVSRDAICASIKDMFEEKRSILEPAGALALAGAEAYCKFYNLKDINVVAITSGANMNFDRLRLVTELANIGKMNITEFKYRYESPEKQALVLYRQEALILIMRRFSLCYLTYSVCSTQDEIRSLVGGLISSFSVCYSVGLHTKFEIQSMVERMESYQLKTIEFTNNDMVKDHLRHLEKRSILEPAGALALAGAEAYCKFYNRKDINVVAITSGANMNFDRLRLVTELANVGRQREAVLATFMPETPGSFKQFAELIGKMNITEFKYRYESPEKQALVLYSVGLHTKFEIQSMVERMESYQLKTIEFTNNDMVKDHLRHLMGGRTNVENELLCRFVFPERPGALMKFLHAISPRWNISLFHYRAQGEMGANVLVGIQVSSSELDEFRYHATSLGYEYELETHNEAFQLLMR